MAIEAAARTHAGRVRTTNEDAWVSRPAAGLFAVVDGMGGEACGEVAAAIAVQALAEVPDLPGLAGETILAQAFTAARERILAAADEDPEKEGMGAVATAVRFDDGGGVLSVAHVGDSRAYLVGVAGVRVLTHDHLAEGRPGTKRQVARDLGRRDLRGEWVETSRVRVAAGDLVVLCSDGLHDVVPADELGRELVKLRAEARTADAVATRLVGMALSAGGPDNVTVVAVRVGRFRRGRQPRSFAAPVAALAGAAAGALVMWLVARSAGAPEPTLPASVPRDTTLAGLDERVAASATHTRVLPGASLRVVGERLRGSDWSVSLVGDANLQIERVVVALERELFVEVEAGGTLLLRDVRVERGRLRISGPAGARVLLEHVSLPSEDSLVVEGGALVNRVDVGFAASAPSPDPSPAPGAAPPEPAAGDAPVAAPKGAPRPPIGPPGPETP
jgi:protein phosphatase